MSNLLGSIRYMLLVQLYLYMFHTMHVCIRPVNVKIMRLNCVRMGDRKVLLRRVKRKMVPLFPMQGNQAGDQPRVLPIKVMVRKLQ